MTQSKCQGRFNFTYDCRICFKERAALVMTKSFKIARGYDCRMSDFKHVSKAHDILPVVHENHKQVISLIYTKQCVT